MKRGPLALLLVVFVLGRMFVAWGALNPDSYAAGGAPFLADVDLYGGWADRISVGNEAPYSDVQIEYPPGALPFILGPEALTPGEPNYRAGFIRLMLLVDLAGFIGLFLIMLRWGSQAGLWFWALAIPLLGPLAYARLDLVPAVAVIWAIQRMAARGWFGLGGWLGFGVLAKIWPAFLIPAAFLGSPRRARTILGMILVGAAGSLAVLGGFGDMLAQVLTYQIGRGIHIESTWGSLLLIAGEFGLVLPIEQSHTTFHFSTGVAAALKPISTLALIGVAGLAAWLAAASQGRGRRLAIIFCATTVTSIGLGNVFSPQFILWGIAAMAAALCVPGSMGRVAPLCLLGAAALTQWIYPLQYAWLLEGRPLAIAILAARNLLVLGAGLWIFVALIRRGARGGPAGPAAPGPEAAEPVLQSRA